MSETEAGELLLPLSDPKFIGAKEVIRILREAGYEAFIVGGAVRDLIMRILPQEYDIATSAAPHEVIRLFKRTVPVGAKFGVVLVILRGCEYQVATFRVDLAYTDGRRPDAVRFAKLREDVLRRDFTMNGLALDPETGKVYDYVGGISDIKARLIRAIGNPAQRFAEDYLRPLRAVRFAAQTGFEIEKETWEAVCGAAPLISKVSAERVREEIHKILVSKRPGLGLVLLYKSKILQEILPDLAQSYHEQHAQMLNRLAGKPAEVLWAGFLWPLGHEGAHAAARRLKHSRKMVQAIYKALEATQRIARIEAEDVAVQKRLLRQPEALWAIDLLEASAGPDSVAYARRQLRQWTKEDLFPPRLLGTEELLALGLQCGPKFGDVLRRLEDAQLRGEVKEKEEAIKFVQSLVKAEL